MREPVPYDRRAAVRYAHRWAFGRNPAYYDYEEVGGDCTSFASQCLYAGIGVMDYTPDYGWYYLDANNKAPAWAGVSTWSIRPLLFYTVQWFKKSRAASLRGAESTCRAGPVSATCPWWRKTTWPHSRTAWEGEWVAMTMVHPVSAP